jgi:HK97 family phage major capsid protein
MTNINDIKGHFATKAELLELTKALNTDSNSAGDIIQPELDSRLQNMVVKKYPFYTWLDGMGMIQDTSSNKPSYLKKVSGGAGSFIAEAGTIPDVTDSVYDLVTGTMTTHVFPLEISDQLIAGGSNDVVNVLQQEIQDGLEYNVQAINNEMLNGTGANNGFNGLIDLIDTNTKRHERCRNSQSI